MSWMSWNFVRFKINFWIDAESFSFLSWKTKKFHSEKKYFFSAVSKHAKIIPKDGASYPNFQWSDSGKSPCLSKLPANLSTCFTRENAAVFPALYATALYISSYVVCIWVLMVQSTVICKIKGGKLFGVFNFMRVWQPHGFGPYPILHWKDSILI